MEYTQLQLNELHYLAVLGGDIYFCNFKSFHNLLLYKETSYYIIVGCCDNTQKIASKTYKGQLWIVRSFEMTNTAPPALYNGYILCVYSLTRRKIKEEQRRRHIKTYNFVDQEHQSYHRWKYSHLLHSDSITPQFSWKRYKGSEENRAKNCGEKFKKRNEIRERNSADEEKEAVVLMYLNHQVFPAGFIPHVVNFLLEAVAPVQHIQLQSYIVFFVDSLFLHFFFICLGGKGREKEDYYGGREIRWEERRLRRMRGVLREDRPTTSLILDADLNKGVEYKNLCVGGERKGEKDLREAEVFNEKNIQSGVALLFSITVAFVVSLKQLKRCPSTLLFQQITQKFRLQTHGRSSATSSPIFSTITIFVLVQQKEHQFCLQSQQQWKQFSLILCRFYHSGFHHYWRRHLQHEKRKQQNGATYFPSTITWLFFFHHYNASSLIVVYGTALSFLYIEDSVFARIRSKRKYFLVTSIAVCWCVNNNYSAIVNFAFVRFSPLVIQLQCVALFTAILRHPYRQYLLDSYWNTTNFLTFCLPLKEFENLVLFSSLLKKSTTLFSSVKLTYFLQYSKLKSVPIYILLSSPTRPRILLSWLLLLDVTKPNFAFNSEKRWFPEWCCDCAWITSTLVLKPLLTFWLYLILFVFAATMMQKVLRSYSRKSERKHEQSGEPPDKSTRTGNAPYVTSTASSVRNGGGTHASGNQQHLSESYNHSSERDGGHYRNGHVNQHSGGVGADQRYYDTAFMHEGGAVQSHQQQKHGFSESSSYEAREHYERKIQRGKKSRSDKRATNGFGASTDSVNELRRVGSEKFLKLSETSSSYLHFYRI